MNYPPLHQIISQIGTVTYTTGKIINSIITPYILKKYTIGSTFEFIQITKTISKPKLSAPLDENLFTNVPVDENLFTNVPVDENLFTNVPVQKTMQIILDNVCI